MAAKYITLGGVEGLLESYKPRNCARIEVWHNPSDPTSGIVWRSPDDGIDEWQSTPYQTSDVTPKRSATGWVKYYLED